MKLGTLEIDAASYGSQGNAILGIRDSGKTYTATYLAEQLFDAGIPWIAFDPIGVWRFMRMPGKGKGYPIVVAGGQEADVPLTVANAPAIVEAAMVNGVSLVIDLFDIHLSKANWRAIVKDCVRLLLHRNKEYGLRHIFLEEAPEFAPQKILDGDVYAEIEKLARMGGNSRLGYTLIGQRAQELNKAVLELCENLFLHRQKGKNAIDALRKWLEIAGASGTDVINSLPLLPQGTCWAWMADSDVPVRIEVPEKRSYHPDRRVMHGDIKVEDRKAVSVKSFVDKLITTLPKLEEEAAANDPKKLRAQLTAYQRQLQANPTAAQLQELDRLRISEKDVRTQLDAVYRELSQARRVIERVDAALKGRAWATIDTKRNGEDRVDPAPKPAAAVQTRPLVTTHPDVNMIGEVPAGCAKPLAALAGAYPGGMTESQWAAVAGYKRTGGTWLEYRRRLVRASMIEKRDGQWFATGLGANSAGEVELPPPIGPELARWWAARTPGTKRIVDVLIDRHPEPLSRDDLAAQLEMTASGGTFLEYVRRLKRNDIAVETGSGLRLSEAVMGG